MGSAAVSLSEAVLSAVAVGVVLIVETIDEPPLVALIAMGEAASLAALLATRVDAVLAPVEAGAAAVDMVEAMDVVEAVVAIDADLEAAATVLLLVLARAAIV